MARKLFRGSAAEQLIGRIYDMALEPELSEAVMIEVGDLLGGAAVDCGYFQLTDDGMRYLGHAVRFDPEAIRRLTTEFSTPESNPLVAQVGALPPRTAIQMEQLVDPKAFEGTPLHRTLFYPHGFTSCLVSVLAKAPSFGGAAVYKAGEFERDEVATFERLIPHFTRSLQIRQRLLGAEQERFGATEALDRLPFGVIFVGFQHELLFANRAAEAMLRQADGLSQSGGRLRAATRAISGELKRLIAAAAATAAGRGIGAGGALALPRPSGLRPLLAQVMPLRYDAPVFGARAPAAVLFVSDPECAQELPQAALVRFFGLTPQQAAMAVALTQGYSVEAAAERLGITRNTARTHLKQIYEKTGTHRQAELVRLLMTSPAVLDGD